VVAAAGQGVFGHSIFVGVNKRDNMIEQSRFMMGLALRLPLSDHLGRGFQKRRGNGEYHTERHAKKMINRVGDDPHKRTDIPG
jgi:hypothetical protein